MSRILYDFQCFECNEIEEKLVDSSIVTATCGYCGGEMTRLISTPTIRLDGCDPGFPTAYDKWAIKHEKQAKLERDKA